MLRGVCRLTRSFGSAQRAEELDTSPPAAVRLGSWAHQALDTLTCLCVWAVWFYTPRCVALRGGPKEERSLWQAMYFYMVDNARPDREEIPWDRAHVRLVSSHIFHGFDRDVEHEVAGARLPPLFAV